MKSGKSERWREGESERGAERSTNLKERISSGRVIKSESQQTYPRLSPPFSPLYSHLFTVISRLSIPELPFHFSLSLSTSCVSASIFMFSACSSSPVPGQLPSISFFPLKSGNSQTQKGDKGSLEEWKELLLKKLQTLKPSNEKGLIDDQSECHQQSMKKKRR